MANCGKEILLTREGTEQMQRFLEALDPASVKLNDFGLEEWMKFAFQFAKKVNYFELNDSNTPSGDWRDFFKAEKELEAFLKSISQGESITPHLALFVSFIYLLEFSKNRFNKLTQRHLDFFYHNILKLEKLPATPDKVHVIFELAKNCTSEKISEGTQLDAGKDAGGKKLIYKTANELIANQIKIAQLKTVYNDINSSKIRAAEIANSFDGLGGDFTDDDKNWWPFGYSNDPKYPALSNAKTGFAISSELLEMQEGLRNVMVTIDFETNLKSVSQGALQRNVEVYCSGTKKWLGPFLLQPNVLDGNDAKVIFSTGLNTTSKSLQLAFQIPKTEDPLVNYDAKNLGENFETNLPVCRFLIKTDSTEGYSLYSNLASNKITQITLDVDVRGITTIDLENDNGKLNATKPFLPFGNRPLKKSNFYISYPELFKKEWKKLNLDMQWKNTPDKIPGSKNDAFKDLYYAYRSNFVGKVSIKEYEDTVAGSSNIIVNNNDHFKALLEIQNRENWMTVKSDLKLFKWIVDKFKTQISISNEINSYSVDEKSKVRLSLIQTFLHEMYPRIYSLALGGGEKETLIPNEPYTSLAESVTLNYSARKELVNTNTKVENNGNRFLFFYEHPFGQTLQYTNETAILDLCVPEYKNGGELYIGLEKAAKLQQVSVLVQVLEGSENPEVESFAENEKIEWSMLGENKWWILDSSSLIENQTDNFLKSGIVKFAIPREATNTNTLLPGNLFWVRAKMEKDFDAVCKTIDITANAVLAEFEDNLNELSHLEKGMSAETVSKLIQRIPGVKSVSQPFNSFSGKPEENDSAYYQRVSERLRHKNRAITLWDYEHLVLQQFPEIHKVKCLNHSKIELVSNKIISNFLSPGNVLIVVIPDIVNKNVFDIYQPRVSSATLNKVQNFVNSLNTLHVNAAVINPDYEEVEVSLKVKFYKGYDENYYKQVLNNDITKMLSPWAFEKTSGLKFGLTLHRSIVINYIEKLDYVDYVKDLKLIRGNEINLVNVAPTSPISILVSAKLHDIELDN